MGARDEYDGSEEENDEEEGEHLEVEPVGEDLEEEEDEEEEDEEEEEGQDEYEKDGWMVDEVEEEEEEEEKIDEEEEARRRKKKRRREKEYQLDDDDFKLLEDNLPGFHRPNSDAANSKKFKRLKKARKVNEGFEGEQFEEEEEEDLGRTAEEQLERNLFGDDEGVAEDIPEAIPEEEEEVEEEEDEMADFIVEEADENGEPVRRRRAAKKKGYGGASGVSSMALQEAQEIFGDVTELLERRKQFENMALQREIEEEGGYGEETYDEYGRLVEPPAKVLSKQYEPSVLEQRFMTEKDEEIRMIDVPERIQLLEELVGSPSSENKMKEATWIFDRVFGHLANPPRPEYRQIEDLLQQARNLNKEEAEKCRAKAQEMKEKGIQQIRNVLIQLHDSKVEVPVIGMHRKKLCRDLLQRERLEHSQLHHFDALWAVQKWDKKWLLMQKRKNSLKTSFERPRIDLEEEEERRTVVDEMLYALEEGQSEQQMEDVSMKFMLQFPPEESPTVQGQFKRPKRRSLYDVCKKAGLKLMTRYFGLTAFQLGENLQALYKQNEVEDEANDPEFIAQEFVRSEFPTVQTVIKGARHMMEVEIGVEPGVREHVRNFFLERAVVSTRPTTSGMEGIDTFHRYSGVKWLLNKPVRLFMDEQWLLICKAEEEGLLEVNISLPQDMISVLTQEFESAFLSDGVSRSAQLWNEQRRIIIQDSLQKRLLPSIKEETRHVLTGRAKQYVTGLIGESLWKKVSVCPYDVRSKQMDDVDDGSPWLKVMACCWGPGNPATTFVMLDENGEMVDYLHTGFINLGSGSIEQTQRREKDEERLEQFMKDHKPHLVVLGAANLGCRKLQERIHEVIFRITEKFPRFLPKGVPKLPVVFEDESLAHLYEKSSVSVEQLPGQPGIVRRAVALGRYMQNRIAMVATLCGPSREILSTRLHAFQDLLPPDDVYEEIERVMITVVNQVGIDINLAAMHEWMFTPLQFVCGLGPRKAAFLQRKIRAESILRRRRDLVEFDWLKACVFINSAVPIRIRGQEDPLDDTRIHPETYELAQKIALDVYCDAHRMHPADVESQELDVVMEVRDNPRMLEKFDIEEYASLLKAGGYGDEYEVLVHVKQELMHPYAEKRVPYEEWNANEEFYLLSGETEDTLAEGRVVLATVTKLLNSRVLCQLDSGLMGAIDKKDLSDDPNVEIESKVTVGSVVTCRVKEVMKAKYQVMLTCKGSDLRSEHWKDKIIRDKYYVRDPTPLLAPKIAAAKKKAEEEKRKMLKPRMIHHPNFKNVSMLDAIQLLKDKEVGEFVIRPSSKGPTNLSITVKFYDGVFTHIDILESGKDLRDMTSVLKLGKRLLINGEHYEDLDEVVARYVDPLTSHLREMISYRKFRKGSKSEIDDILRQEKAETPNRIPYYLSVSYDHAGAFLLSYIRSSSPKHEYISLYPSGFRFRKKDFSSPDKLIKYFQTHINEPPPEHPSHNRRVLAAVVPSIKGSNENILDKSRNGDGGRIPSTGFGIHADRNRSFGPPSGNYMAGGNAGPNGAFQHSSWGASTGSNVPGSIQLKSPARPSHDTGWGASNMIPSSRNSLDSGWNAAPKPPVPAAATMEKKGNFSRTTDTSVRSQDDGGFRNEGWETAGGRPSGGNVSAGFGSGWGNESNASSAKTSKSDFGGWGGANNSSFGKDADGANNSSFGKDTDGGWGQPAAVSDDNASGGGWGSVSENSKGTVTQSGGWGDA